MRPHIGSFRRPALPREILARWLCLLAAGSFLVSWASAASSRVVITPTAGFTITWDGNNGGFFSPDAGAGPSNNVALASNGTVAIGSSEYGNNAHYIAYVNDGFYGNSSSWISDFTIPDPDPFIGLAFAAPVEVSSIAWSRDNGDNTHAACSGVCRDRNVGLYTLQYTEVTAPDATTPDTGDAATGWATLGTIQYLAGDDTADFSGYLRHRFDVALGGAPISASGLRIKVSDPGICIDEIEVNPIPDPVPPISTFIEITPRAGFSINWDRNEGINSTPDSPAPAPENDASVSRGTVAFGSSQLDFGVHFIANVNDGLYGNAHSWIPDFAAVPDPMPYIGLNFGRLITLRSIAWSRDNGDVAGDCCGGTLVDRALGVYVLQITTMPDPGLDTPDACGLTPEGGWVTIGTINYKADDLTYFNSYLRHRFEVAQGGSPIAATGLRILVPNNNSAIDEIEINSNLALEQEAIQIEPAPGLGLSWDGNDGDFNDPAAGAAPPPNRALATEGTIPFASSELGPVLSLPFHLALNLNDGLYGNAHSWISANGIGGTSDPDLFVGLNFGGEVAITNIAWGRDNGDLTETGCAGGTCVDRALDAYRLQYTLVPEPDGTTPDTGDAATGWADLGTVTYAGAAPPFFTPYLRHRFEVSEFGGPLTATGLRIKVANGLTAIDEIEVNTSAESTPAVPPVGLSPALGYDIVWDGNEGHYFDPGAGAAPPPNDALASEGTTPFTSSDLGPLLGISWHVAANLNDGLYGNAYSWISANGIGGTSDPDPFAGLNFNDLISITNIAWSRDNGDNAEFQGTDRTLGVYTLQVTTVPAPDASTADTGDPATGWVTIGTVDYRRNEPPIFRSHLRHRFDVSGGGFAIEASGLRIKVPNGSIDIDEIEVNTAATRPLPSLKIQVVDSQAVISWTGGGGLQVAPSVTGPWECLQNAVSPYSVSLEDNPAQFYRVSR